MSSRTAQRGTLYVVATPIGNLRDITERAREVLSRAAVIAAEDTRHSGQLLKHLGIAKPLVSLHEHNESRRAQELIARLTGGEDVALVSDAGTPLISDPGFDLVRAAIAHGVQVVPIPGACAAVAALSISGLPTDRFAFEGFLPAKAAARRDRLASLRQAEHTLIFYEAPHRLADTLDAMAEAFGTDRTAVVAREITKQFESTYRGTLAELSQRAKSDSDMSRGEIVIVVAGTADRSEDSIAMDVEQVLRTLLEELPPAQAAKLAAKLTGTKRGELYDRAVELSAK
jgi:16S rRNA (cytidine1402-2'-O)-methyltransferase